MVVFGQKWLYLGKSDCSGIKVLVFGQTWLYWGFMVVFRKKLLSSEEVVVIGQSGCIRGKVVVFGNLGCIRVKVFCILAKVVVLVMCCIFSGKSGCIRAKVVVFGQSGCIRAKVVVLGQKWL